MKPYLSILLIILAVGVGCGEKKANTLNITIDTSLVATRFHGSTPPRQEYSHIFYFNKNKADSFQRLHRDLVEKCIKSQNITIESSEKVWLYFDSASYYRELVTNEIQDSLEVVMKITDDLIKNFKHNNQP